MLDINLKPSLQLHIHKNNENQNSPVTIIKGTGQGYASEIEGNVTIKSTPNRTTLHLEGAGAMKITGGLTIGG